MAPVAGSSFFQEARLPEQRAVEGVAFPAVLVPAGGSLDEFLATVRSERASRVEPLLREAGAVLLRGFPARTAADFDAAVEAFGYEELPYVGGAAPRTNVVGRVFTANESPPDQKIPFHHEMAQVSRPPAFAQRHSRLKISKP
uniref:TauD/TfdA-like domain-containing protein n=1 Tax=Aegilops tauschii subsp. strangulata TaxID=200361 RepID=A0A453E6D4_AEGTS